MFHLIKYSVIRKVKNFSMLFWPCMFPLILGTLFYFAFGNISESDFETVQAAFVEENPGDSVFPSFLEEVSKEGTLIHVETMTEKEALQKLEDQKISGIFYGTETPYLKVRKKRTCSEYYAKSSGELSKWKGYAGNSGRCTS